MTEQDVLKKAINIALKNGMEHTVVDEGTFYQTYARIKLRTGEAYHPTGFSPKDCYGLIFNHQFAKAFWSSNKYEEQMAHISVPMDENKNGIVMSQKWAFHLQQMVLYNNPINYLRKFIENE